MYRTIIHVLLKNKKFYRNKSLFFAFVCGMLSGIGYTDFEKKQWYAAAEPVGQINLCFTPPSGCGELIAKWISRAQKEVLVQAYGLTSQKIIDALIQASKNGCSVRIILDRSNMYDPRSGMHRLMKAGQNIEIKIDKASGIAHNKVMIIDRSSVISGSFNFTKDADKRNVENVILINDVSIAKQYLNNWHKRYATSISAH